MRPKLLVMPPRLESPVVWDDVARVRRRLVLGDVRIFGRRYYATIEPGPRGAVLSLLPHYGRKRDCLRWSLTDVIAWLMQASCRAL